MLARAVVNWLRSTREKLETMRYGGEFKLAGGNVDEGESVEACAKRELVEEFLRPAETQVPPEAIVLRPFSVKQTRPIRSRSKYVPPGRPKAAQRASCSLLLTLT